MYDISLMRISNFVDYKKYIEYITNSRLLPYLRFMDLRYLGLLWRKFRTNVISLHVRNYIYYI